MSNQASKAIDSIYRINLGVKKTERAIVFTDGYNSKLRKITKRIAESGVKFTPHISYIEYQPTGSHGIEPPEGMWREAFGENVHKEIKRRRLFKPLLAKKTSEAQNREIEKIIKAHREEAVDAVIALSYYSTSHTKFRDLLNRICGTRYASMPLFDEEMLSGAMKVNYKKMLERTTKIARAVNKSEQIEIKTPNGTLITLSKKGREAKADTGIITKPGTFSNLPAGEVYLAPLEGTANGRLVLDWAPTRKLKSPMTLHVEKGMAIKVGGKEKYVEYLQAKLSEKKENANIAELGIGMNDKASRPDNILESEKIFGTIHIALGDNSTFGGKVRASFHQDFVFFKPTVTLVYKNGRKKHLLRNGKLIT
ncbi:MAG: aminopeptidase [Nitrospirae bacterium]|nr:aminopeptidase [Nitrospirota bacterium]